MGSPFRSSRKNSHEDLFIPSDFEFLTVEDALDINLRESPKQSGKSPVRVLVDEVLGPAVMSALSTVVSNEGLFVVNIAKSVLTGAAATLSTSAAGVVPGVAVGALIAGGIIAYQKLRSRSMLASDVIKTLSPQQQKVLINRLGRGLKSFGVKNMATDIIQRKEVKDAALSILSAFLEERYRIKLIKE